MILSIESSCDDSSIAITHIDSYKLVYHKKISQEKEHSLYGGVVPELASRLNAVLLPKILQECKQYFNELKAIAVTSYPGLSLTLTEGIVMAKALSLSLKIPLISINHLKGHIFSLFIEKKKIFPITVLLVSGGHTQLIEAKSETNIHIIGQSIDDSFGESFDKVAKMLSLDYPGGPIVEKYAAIGNENRFKFPVPLKQSSKIEFSYSGIKNAVRVQILTLLQTNKLSIQDKQDICASFQKKATEHILMKLKKYFKKNKPITFAIVGGASANKYLRTKIVNLLDQFNCNNILLPNLEYCSDNAAMIGRVAIEQYHRKDFTSIHNIDIKTKRNNYEI